MSVVGESMSALRLGNQGTNASAASAVDTSSGRRARGCSPERPTKLSRQHEHRRVVRVGRQAHAHRVGPPPAGPTILDRDQQGQRRQQEQGHQHAISPRLGRVEDHEGAQRRQGRGHQRRAVAHGAATDRIDERDRSDPGDQRREPHQLRAQPDPGREPRQHEPERRRDLGRRRHRLHHTREPSSRHHPVRRQLIGEQILAGDHPPQQPADHHQHRHGHGHRDLSEAPHDSELSPTRRVARRPAPAGRTDRGSPSGP